MHILYRRVVTNVGSIVVAYVVPILLFMLTTPYILRRLGANQNGVWLLSTSLVGYFAIYRTGVAEAITKYLSDGHANGGNRDLIPLFRTSLSLLLSLSIGQFFLVHLIVLPWVPILFQNGGGNLALLRSAISLTSIGLIPSVMTIPFSAVPASLQRYGVSSVVSLVSSVATTALTCLLLYLGHGLLAIIIGNIVITFAVLLVYIVIGKMMLPELSFLPGWNCDSLRCLGRFSGFSTITCLLSSVTSLLDRTVVGVSLGPAAVTYYSIPAGIARRPWDLCSAVAQMLVPMTTESICSGPTGRFERLCVVSNRVLSACVLAISVGIVYSGPAFLNLWLGVGFAERAGTLFRAQAMILALIATCAPSYYVLNGLGRPEVNTRACALGGLLMTGLLVVLVPLVGVLGAALSFAGYLIGLSLAPVRLLREYFTQHPWRTAIKIWGVPIGIWLPMALAPTITGRMWPRNPSILSVCTLAVVPMSVFLFACVVGELLTKDPVLTHLFLRLLNRGPHRRLRNSTEALCASE